MSEKYTKEQNEALKDIYKYQSKAELTQDEIDTVIEMFDKPEKFVILRKIFQVFTQEEREIQIPSEEALVSTNPEDVAKYGLQVAINTRADEKIRQALLNFYSKVKTWHVSNKEKEFDAEIALEKEEKDKIEQMEEEKKLAKQKVGENI